MTENLQNQLTVAPPGECGRLRGCRDRELLTYVGRLGIVSLPQAMEALGVGRSVTYDRVASCIGAGLLERIELLRGEPSLLRATRAGLRYAGLALPEAVVSPGAVDHWLRCAEAARILGGHHGHHHILTERELAFAERHESRPIASAKLAELPDGRPRLHRPDLVILPAGHPLTRLHVRGGGPSLQGTETDVPRGLADFRGEPGLPGSSSPRRTDSCVTYRHPTEDTGMRSVRGGVIAVEVELTPKSPRRLRQILRGWRRASWVTEVHYLCEPGPTRRAVERAVEELHASDRIRIAEAPCR